MPAFLRRKIVNGMIYLVHGKMTDLGFPPATVRVHTTSSAVLVSHIAYQRVIVKNGIKSLAGRQITFTDGSSEEFDVLIGATGYRIDLPFLAPEILSVKDNQLDLYKRIIAPGWNGLYFFGFINITTALNLAFEYQARWITAIETGNVTLPAAEKMHEAVRRKRDWMRQTFKQTLRHTLEEEHLTYFAELRVPKDQARYPDKLPV
jgi:hypothetical protein